MKSEDLQIISYMRNNCRNSITKMSQDMGMPLLDMMDRIKAYERNYIKNYTCVLDFQKVGFKFDGYMIIQITKGLKRHFERFTATNKNINSFFKLNEGEYLIEVLFKDEERFNKFLDKIKKRFGILDLKVLKINHEFKRESFLESQNAEKSFKL